MKNVLTSNYANLEVKKEHSPFMVFNNAGVPISLATDGQGILRIDLAHEYRRALQWFGLTYTDLKTISYEGIRAAFVTEAKRKQPMSKLNDSFAVSEKK